MAWFGIIASVIYNYVQHRRHKATICSLTRRVLPPWLLLAAWSGFSGWLLSHLLRGYPRRGY